MFDCVQVAKATLENKVINFVCLNNLEVRFWLYRWSTKKSHECLAGNLISCKYIQLLDTESPAIETNVIVITPKHASTIRCRLLVPMQIPLSDKLLGDFPVIHRELIHFGIWMLHILF